jgi:2-phospho-L-lactate transferase/gluconeogenesis factor (CofD/UPF0052 family)
MTVLALLAGLLLGSHHHHAPPIPIYPVTDTDVHLEYRFAIDQDYVTFETWNRKLPECKSIGDYVTDIPGEPGTAMAVTFVCNTQ